MDDPKHPVNAPPVFDESQVSSRLEDLVWPEVVDPKLETCHHMERRSPEEAAAIDPPTKELSFEARAALARVSGHGFEEHPTVQ